MRGTIHRLIRGKGFGFIQVDGRQYFFHHSEVRELEFKQLTQGDVVEFEFVDDQDGRNPRAINVVVVEKKPKPPPPPRTPEPAKAHGRPPPRGRRPGHKPPYGAPPRKPSRPAPSSDPEWVAGVAPGEAISPGRPAADAEREFVQDLFPETEQD